MAHNITILSNFLSVIVKFKVKHGDVVWAASLF